MTSLYKDRMQISIHVYSGKPRTITGLKEAIREEMRASSQSVCENVMDNFVLRFKEYTELNSGHLEKMLYSTQEQADRHHVLALHLKHNIVVVSKVLFNLNGNLPNDAHRKLGPVFFLERDSLGTLDDKEKNI